METKMSGQIFSLGIARDETNPPAIPSGIRQSNSLDVLGAVIVLAYA
jgi:hypothetical protein